MNATSSSEPLLEVRSVTREFSRETNVIDALLRRGREPVRAVDDVSISLDEQEIKGVIGESGCGKTTLLMMAGRLLSPTRGSVRFNGRDVNAMERKERLNFHSEVQFVFQDPFNSLNPRMTVREALMESLKIHGMGDRDERIHRVLERVELNPPERFVDQRPPNLSGGEKQRVSIARALILEPSVILADEPVSMLDVSTQAAILKLLRGLSNDLGISILYISHDISTVSYLCEEVNVMYLGRIVERGPTRTVINDPKHPYTQALINAVPVPDPHRKRERTQLDGSTPDPIGLGEGCRFRDRCPSIIPPEELAIDQRSFREIMTLRQRIDKDDNKLERILEHLDTPNTDQFVSAMYDRLFETELDGEHRANVESALRALTERDWGRAANALADYESVCETTPRFVQTGEQRQAACHLYYDHDLQTATAAQESALVDGGQTSGDSR